MDTTYLLAANIVVWTVMGGYLVYLALKQKRLDSRLKHLELLKHDGQES